MAGVGCWWWVGSNYPGCIVTGKGGKWPGNNYKECKHLLITKSDSINQVLVPSVRLTLMKGNFSVKAALAVPTGELLFTRLPLLTMLCAMPC